MTVIENEKTIGQKGVVASPRLSPTEDGLAELLFGPIGSSAIFDYIHRFYALNGGPVVVP